MREIRPEAMIGPQLPLERLEVGEIDLFLAPARPADEVTMPFDARAMPACHSSIDVRVRDRTEPFERLEVAIDGRGIDLGVPSADVTGDLLGRRVVPRPGQRLENEAALQGHPPAVLPYLLFHAHVAIVAQKPVPCNKVLLQPVAITFVVWPSSMESSC